MRAFLHLAAAAAVAFGGAPARGQSPAAAPPRPGADGVLGSVAVPSPHSAELVVDTDGDGRAELVLLGADGTARRYGLALAGAILVPRGEVHLPDPGHCLVAFADVDPAPGREFVVADGSGTSWYGWPATADAAPAVHPLVRRARLGVRTDRPQLRPFVQDLDRDGRQDLLLPTLDGIAPFVQEAPGPDGAPRFRALERLPVPVATSVGRAGPGLDEEHEGSVSIPPIETADLDGDGRPDLVTVEKKRHGFWLQKPGGGFREPITVDLQQFEDSTPKAAVAPGSTLVLGDEQLLQRGDVDGNGIPDFVVAHRRKIWTFLGSKDGPQFTKARTQAVADDTSAMLLVDLDDDKKADLLTFQVQVPSVGALVLAMVRSLDIDVRAVAYRSEAGGFAALPAWRRTVTLRIPSLLSLLNQQEELVRRFTSIVEKARLGVKLREPLPGATSPTPAAAFALLRTDGSAIECFAAAPAPADLASAAGRALLRRLLFEDENTIFDLDRLFALLAGFVSRRDRELVGDAPPFATLSLRDPAAFRPLRLLAGDFDGAPGDEVVVVYGAPGDDRAVAIDVLRVPTAR